jgi:hypothetical protein
MEDCGINYEERYMVDQAMPNNIEAWRLDKYRGNLLEGMMFVQMSLKEWGTCLGILSNLM